MITVKNGIQLEGAQGVSGKVIISPKAVATVLEMTAGTVKDVQELTKKFQSVFGAKFPNLKFVHTATLKLINGELVADVYIKVGYDVNIVQTSYQVQKEIMTQFMEMMDLKINRVNVHVVELLEEA